jgi:hypothetical protein
VDGGRETVDGGRETVDGGRETVDGGRFYHCGVLAEAVRLKFRLLVYRFKIYKYLILVLFCNSPLPLKGSILQINWTKSLN